MNCDKKQCNGKMRVLETRTLDTKNMTRLEIMTAQVPYSIVTEGNAIYRRDIKIKDLSLELGHKPKAFIHD